MQRNPVSKNQKPNKTEQNKNKNKKKRKNLAQNRI
jgi:hypothetical protein